MEESLDELKLKASLYEVLRFVRQTEFQWLEPLVRLNVANEPSVLLYVLGQIHVIGGSKVLDGVLRDRGVSLLCEYMRKLTEEGGHPLSERGALAFIRLASGISYEKVLRDEKRHELTMLEPGGDKEQAVERVKARVKRARKHIVDSGLEVKHMSPTVKRFFKLLELAAEKARKAED